MSNTLNSMYGQSDADPENSEENILPKLSKSPIKSSTAKTKIIEINGQQFEIVNQQYVDNLESELKRIRRDLKVSIGRSNRALRDISKIYHELTQIRRELSKKQNVFGDKI